MQGNNKLRVFSGNTSNYIADADLDGATVQTGAVNGGAAASNLYNSLSLTTTLACTSLIDFVAQYNPSITFGQTTPIETWITAVGNAIASKTSVDNIVNGTTTVMNATNATNVDVNNLNTGDNAVVNFQLGNGTAYNKTINNVENATYAEYASSDTSKGTIEERLTALGFKQGAFIPNNNYKGTSSAGEYELKSITGEITRQGNYVIGNVSWSVELVNPKPFAFVDFQSGIIGYIPNEFYPETDINIPIVLFYYDYSSGSAFPTEKANTTYITIKSNGEIYIPSSWHSYSPITLGYEAAPL